MWWLLFDSGQEGRNKETNRLAKDPSSFSTILTPQVPSFHLPNRNNIHQLDRDFTYIQCPQKKKGKNIIALIINKNNLFNEYKKNLIIK